MLRYIASRFVGGAAAGAGFVAGGAAMAQVPQVRAAAHNFAQDIGYNAAQGGVAGAAHQVQHPDSQAAIDATAKRAASAARKGAIGF